MLTLTIVASALLAGYAVTRSEERCAPWRQRSTHVGFEELQAAKRYADVGIHPMPPILQRVTRRAGLAFPGIAFVDEEHLDDTGVLAHEAAHLQQMRRDGLPRFFLRYSVDFLRGVYLGCDLQTSYLSVGYEKRSYAAGRVVAFQEKQEGGPASAIRRAGGGRSAVR